MYVCLVRTAWFQLYAPTNSSVTNRVLPPPQFTLIPLDSLQNHNVKIRQSPKCRVNNANGVIKESMNTKRGEQNQTAKSSEVHTAGLSAPLLVGSFVTTDDVMCFRASR